MSRSFKSRKPKNFKKPMPKASSRNLLKGRYVVYSWIFKDLTRSQKNHIDMIRYKMYHMIEKENEGAHNKNDLSFCPEAMYIGVEEDKDIRLYLEAKIGKNKYLDMLTKQFGHFTKKEINSLQGFV